MTATVERQPAIDWLKCLSIVAVVVTHSGAAAFPGTPGYTAWDTVFRHLLPAFHVPCLLMISGYLYYRPHPISVQEVSIRLRRVLLPYFIASLVVFALLPAHPGVGDKILALLFAEALPIYYYVFLLTLFIALLPVISRLRLRGVLAGIALTLLGLVALVVRPEWRLTLDFRWAMRNPVESFGLGYFLLGWSFAAAALPISPRRIAVVLALAGSWPLCIWLGSPYPAILLAKIPYALAIWMLAWRFLNTSPAPRVVQAISDSTYGIFLYHFLFMEPLFSAAAAWSAPVRIGVLSCVGLGGGLAGGAIIRQVLGKHQARVWFGY